MKLLEAIKEYSISYMDNKYDAAIILDSIKSLFAVKQKDNEGLIDYSQRFRAAEEVMRVQIGDDGYLAIPRMDMMLQMRIR